MTGGGGQAGPGTGRVSWGAGCCVPACTHVVVWEGKTTLGIPCFRLKCFRSETRRLDPSHTLLAAAPQRFPRWMWRNTSVVRFLEWMRHHNLKVGRVSLRAAMPRVM